MSQKILTVLIASLCLFCSICSAHKCSIRVTEPLEPETIERQKNLYKNVYAQGQQPENYIFKDSIRFIQEDYKYLHPNENRLFEFIEGPLYVTGHINFNAFDVNAKADGSFTLPMTLKLNYKLYPEGDAIVNKDIVFVYNAKGKKFYNGSDEIYDIYEKLIYQNIHDTLTRHDIPDNEYYEERKPYLDIEPYGRHLLVTNEKMRYAVKSHQLDDEAIFFEDIDLKEHCDIFNSRLHNVICVTRAAIYNRYYHRHNPKETTAKQLYIVDYIYYKDANGIWKESLADRYFKPQYSTHSEKAELDQKKCDELAKQLQIDGKGWSR